MGTIKTAWDFSLLFKDEAEFIVERRKIEEMTAAFALKWRERQDYESDPIILKEALDELEAWVRLSGYGGGKEGYYLWLMSQLDEGNAELKGRLEKVDEFAKRVGNEIKFFELRLGKIPPEAQPGLLGAPQLRDYRHFLERIFAESKHHLSEAEEKILTLKSGPAHEQWVRMVSGFISREEREVLLEDGTRAKKPFADLMMLLDSEKKEVRDVAAAAVNDVFLAHVDAAEAEMNAIATDKRITDDLRGLLRPDLERHLHDDINSAAVDALLVAVESRFDLAQRYYALKAKLFGVPKLAYHERNVPYGKGEKEYPFPDTLSLVTRVFRRLDEQFATTLETFGERGQLDVFPKKGKHNGAFCAHYSLPHPTYVLLNHGNRLRDVSTLAHEMGHAINNELMREKQNALNFGTPMSTAEVASVFMEDFILEEVLRGVDEETRLAVQMQRLGDEVATAFRQVACYRFEEDLHREAAHKGYLAKKDIGLLFQNRMAAYMGDAVEQSPGSENWWVYWSHIREFFYVYSYASGLLIGKAMQAAVREDPSAIAKVKDFLAAGYSKSPRDIFLAMDIDIADPQFWQKGLGEIERLLADTEALAEKLGNVR